MLMIPAALACGFGELGKHGSIINRELGSSLRRLVRGGSVVVVPEAELAVLLAAEIVAIAYYGEVARWLPPGTLRDALEDGEDNLERRRARARANQEGRRPPAMDW